MRMDALNKRFYGAGPFMNEGFYGNGLIITSVFMLHSPLDVRQKHENRANKWAIKQLITEEELDEAVANGHTEI